MSYRFRARAALAIAALAAAVVWAADDQAPSITPQELEARLAAGGAPLVVDVRTPEEYATGHVPGAINVPVDEVAKRAAELTGRGPLALYCARGPRARAGEAALARAGATDLLHLEGGFTAWEAAGLPVARGAAN